jgi:hypothetical protein
MEYPNILIDILIAHLVWETLNISTDIDKININLIG